jgi:hypothetical protein
MVIRYARERLSLPTLRASREGFGPATIFDSHQNEKPRLQ